MLLIDSIRRNEQRFGGKAIHAENGRGVYTCPIPAVIDAAVRWAGIKTTVMRLEVVK